MKKKLLVLITIALIVFLSSCVEISLSEVDRIHVNWQPKDAYLVDEEVILDDIRLTAYFDDGSDEEFSLANSNVSLRNGYYEENNEIMLDTRTHGDYDIRVSYQGVSVTLSFSVYDAIVTTGGAYYPNPNPSASEPLYVLGDSIQDAIDKTPEEGSWVYVGEGNHTLSDPQSWAGFDVSIMIDKPLNLRTTKNAYLNPDQKVGFVFVIFNTNNERVTIDGFTIGANWEDGAFVQPSSQKETSLYVMNNMILGPETTSSPYGHLIQVTGANSYVYNNTLYVPYKESGSEWASSGVYINRYSNNTIVENNTFIFPSDLGSYGSGVIVQSDYSPNSTPLTHITILGNTFSGGGVGVQVQLNKYNISHLSITDNEFINNYQGLNFFLQMEDSSGEMTSLTITDNAFENNLFDTHVALKLGPTSSESYDNGIRVGSLRTDVDIDHFINNNDFKGLSPYIEEIVISGDSSWKVCTDRPS